MNILVTGATGFVGERLARALAKDNKITALTKSNENRLLGLKNVKVFKCDLAKEGFSKKLPEDVDVIIHLAAVMDNLAIGKDELTAFNLNCASTFELLEYGKRIGIKKFIFASSASVYASQDGPVSEDAKPRPADFYGLTKYISELLVNSYKEDFITLILRLSLFYGPGQREERLVPRFANKIRKEEPLTVFNNGKNPVISLIYVDDLIEILKRTLLVNKPCVVNVSSEDKKSIFEIGTAIGNLIGIKAKFEYKNNPSKRNTIVNIRRMKKIFKYTPKVMFEEGLAKCLK